DLSRVTAERLSVDIVQPYGACLRRPLPYGYSNVDRTIRTHGLSAPQRTANGSQSVPGVQNRRRSNRQDGDSSSDNDNRTNAHGKSRYRYAAPSVVKTSNKLAHSMPASWIR